MRPYTVREAADIIGMSDSYIRAHAESWGGRRYGKVWRLPRTTIDAMAPKDPCPIPSPHESAPTTSSVEESGVSDGANPAPSSNAKKANSNHSNRQKKQPSVSGESFATRFPNHAKLSA